MNPSEESIPSEAEVRAMRDAVFIDPSSDNNWEGCRERWMRPENIKWLRERIAKKLKL